MISLIFKRLLAGLVSVTCASSMASAQTNPSFTNSFAISCPSPDAITSEPIPSSWNAIYYAENQGLSFLGMDLGGIPLHRMAFSSADISAVNDYWQFVCSYSDGAFQLRLATEDADVYRGCFFEDNLRTCRESLKACIFHCQ